MQTSSRSGSGKSELLALIAQLREAFLGEHKSSGSRGGSFGRRRSTAAEGDSDENSATRRQPQPVAIEQQWEEDAWPESQQ